MDKAAEIVHEHSDHRGAFVILSNGKRMASLTYTVAGSYIILDHTQVDDALRGTGAGGKLVKAAVEWARAEHQRLMPLCPFAKSVFDKTPAYADVRAS
jgi:uncharacterized protein